MKIRTRNGRLFNTVLVGLLLKASLGLAQPMIEVVQSVPVETTLKVTGIRLTQDVWLEMINKAQKRIDLEEFYIFSQPGQALEPVLNALYNAASRGVHIRLLVDSEFYKKYPNEPNRLNEVENIDVKTLDFSSHGGIQHSKYFVVDGMDAFVGSANFDWLALSHIHEVGLHLVDEQESRKLEAIFACDWENGVNIGSGHSKAHLTEFPPERELNLMNSQTSSMQVVASPSSENPPDVSDSLSAIIQLMDSATSSIKIQVYQYGTKLYRSSQKWNILDSEIRKAASRGVNVQLLVDAVSLKSGRAELQALAKVDHLEVRAVTLPEWSGGKIPYSRLIHSKYLTVDGASAWVGSENWTGTYFTNTRNVGIALESREIAQKLAQIFDQVWKSAYVESL